MRLHLAYSELTFSNLTCPKVCFTAGIRPVDNNTTTTHNQDVGITAIEEAEYAPVPAPFKAATLNK